MSIALKFCIFSFIYFNWNYLSFAQDMDFDSALARIISRSTDVAIQEAELNATRARNLPIRFSFFPTLSLNGKEPLTGTSSFLSVPRQVELRSDWNLFRWGADIEGINAADSEQKAIKASVSNSIFQVESQGVKALLTEIQKKKVIEVNQRIVNHRIELFRIARERYLRGYLAQQEADRLSVDLENSRAELMNSEIEEANARASLENLLGHSDVEIKWPWKDVFEKKNADRILNTELRLDNRPDWMSAQHQVEVESKRLSRNWRLLFPSLDLQSSYGVYQSYFGSLTGWTGALSVSFPIFDYLEGVSRIKAQSSVRASSEVALEQVKRTAQAEWNSSQSGFRISHESALARDKNLILSRKLYQDNLTRFKMGRITANELAVDQSRLYEAELLAIEGWSAVHTYFTQLCHALGFRVKKCLAELGKK